MAKTMQAIQGFIDASSGVEETVVYGELIRDDHHLVKRHPEMFREVDQRRPAAVEQATAAPGEKRATRSKKTDGGAKG